MRYGFLIDHARCIGCHACTVACKEENGVPLGVFRTWVKYIEEGAFPDARRFFSVLRCNHCDNAPCVAICPTASLFTRPDGIVDFDPARCIGCKSCLQACPYDALYIDPGTRTAAKCHYCAHRVETGLAPACVVVCPEQAIVAGDLDDPASEIARRVASEPTRVRKPEQGTLPKVHYAGVHADALAPLALERGAAYLFAETGRAPEPQALQPSAGGTAGYAARPRTVYDVPRAARPWGWKVSAYLWTKSVAAGAMLLAAAGATGWGTPLSDVWAPLLALVFLAATTALLVADLKRPERFLYILLKPNWRSWLVWGAWILIAFGALAALWLAAGLLGRGEAFRFLAGPAALLAVGAAVYSAFLFGQAEGRDFWQSRWLSWQLLASALAAGAAALLLAALAAGAAPDSLQTLRWVFACALAAQGGIFCAEAFGPHASPEAAAAAAFLREGPLSGAFLAGALGFGVAMPVLLVLAVGGPSATALASVCALGGLWVYENAWIQAGQSVPLS